MRRNFPGPRHFQQSATREVEEFSRPVSIYKRFKLPHKCAFEWWVLVCRGFFSTRTRQAVHIPIPKVLANVLWRPVLWRRAFKILERNRRTRRIQKTGQIS